jgi:hypothetical protein
VLTFNDLLTLEGVDPAQVRLVRHQDRRLRAGRLYEAWRTDRAAFAAYQSAQKRDVFPIGAILASFIVTDVRKTVFVGMYRVDSAGRCLPGATDALLHSDVSGQFKYDLQLLDVLSDYRDKLAIEWGSGTRAWVQRAANQPKPVLEIAEQYEPKFPGFRAFTRLVDDVPTMPSGWQQVLRSVKGSTSSSTSRPVSSTSARPRERTACWGRWMDYATDGHGGNLALKEANKKRRRTYQVSVLEVVDGNTPDETIEQTESYWKSKLLSREFGLNLG